MEDKRLGRGLRSLLSPTVGPPVEEATSEVAVVDLKPNRFQPRQSISDEGIKSLSESIRKHGVLQPIVVRRSGAAYEIVAGERRWRAAMLAGMERVPVRLIRGGGDEQALEVALVENVQREDLDPIAKAKAMRQLIEVFGLSQERVALEVGLDRSTVANTIRLLDLPGEVQELVSRGTLSHGHARAILSAGTPPGMVDLARTVVRNGLSVRQTEGLARGGTSGSGRGAGSKKRAEPAEPWIRDLEGRVREALGCRVEIRKSSGSWTILVSCADLEELNRVSARLTK